jgi:hypothetical protein
MTSSLAAPAARKLRRAPLYVFIAAWTVPVLILGQFALLAALPIVTLMIATLADARLRSMRWWVGAQAVAYATPLAIWAFNPDRAPSLSKDLSPVLAVVLIAVSVVVIVKLHTTRRR